MLFDYLPELHKNKDLENDNYLSKWVDGISPSFELLKDKIRDFGELRDPLKVRSQYDELVSLTLGPQLTQVGAVLQSGIAALVSATGIFAAPTARFYADAIGKSLTISGSVRPENNQTVTVSKVYGPTTIETWPVLEVDSGLQWMLREPVTPPQGQIDVSVLFGGTETITPGWLLYDGSAAYEVMARTALASTTLRTGKNGGISASGNFF